jgi:hypothetical protein
MPNMLPKMFLDMTAVDLVVIIWSNVKVYHGVEREARNGVDTTALFSLFFDFNFQDIIETKASCVVLSD